MIFNEDVNEDRNYYFKRDSINNLVKRLQHISFELDEAIEDLGKIHNSVF